jgi:hypothetical protein
MLTCILRPNSIGFLCRRVKSNVAREKPIAAAAKLCIFGCVSCKEKKIPLFHIHALCLLSLVTFYLDPEFSF